MVRSRKQPKVNRRARLAGSPVLPKAEATAADEKPKKATRKRAPKKAASDE